jgi:hypothetical protein
MNHNLIIRKYPNNEIRAVLYRTKNSSPCGNSVNTDDDQRDGIFDSRPEIKPGTDSPGDAVPHLDISSKLSPGYGETPRKTRFGLNAKRTISRCSGVFEHDKIPKEECLFLTGTIPGGTREAFDAVARWSSWIVKSVKTWISNAGVDSNYSMYCWEFQSRGALHLHYLLTVKDEKTRLFVMWKWAMKWGQLLDAVGKKEGVDMWKRIDGTTWAGKKSVLQAPAQYVRKSVGAYLSKYLSKQAPAPDNNIVGEFLTPVRWWGCSRPLLARLSELSDEVKVEWIAFKDYRSVWERVVEGFRGAAEGFHEYCDKLGFAKVAVSFTQDSDAIYHEFWRDFKCNLNHGNVANNLTGCSPWRPSPETATSGTTWTERLSVNTRRFADQIRVRACFFLSFGKVPKLSKMQWLNIVLKKKPKQLCLSI